MCCGLNAAYRRRAGQECRAALVDLRVSLRQKPASSPNPTRTTSLSWQNSGLCCQSLVCESTGETASGGRFPTGSKANHLCSCGARASIVLRSDRPCRAIGDCQQILVDCLTPAELSIRRF